VDALLIGMTLFFFALAFAFVRGCDRW